MNITPYIRPRTVWGNSLPMRPSLAAHDVQGAFNNTKPEILIKLMILRRMPKYLIEWIKDFTLNRTLSFSFDNQIESPKPFCNGIPQGSLVSPILFSIMMSALMEGDNPKNLQTGTAYVDDLNEVSDSFHYKLQRAKILGLAFAEDKSELIHFSLASRRKIADGQSMIMPDQQSYSEIQPSEQIKLLGIILDNTLTFITHAQNAASRSLQILGSLIFSSGKRLGNFTSYILLFDNYQSYATHALGLSNMVDGCTYNFTPT
jgi:hypothetical protein